MLFRSSFIHARTWSKRLNQYLAIYYHTFDSHLKTEVEKWFWDQSSSDGPIIWPDDKDRNRSWKS
jgi:hypothetical protein